MRQSRPGWWPLISCGTKLTKKQIKILVLQSHRLGIIDLYILQQSTKQQGYLNSRTEEVLPALSTNNMQTHKAERWPKAKERKGKKERYASETAINQCLTLKPIATKQIWPLVSKLQNAI